MDFITLKNVKKCFDLKAKEKVYAVNGVDLTIHKGDAIGLVGESGCGKSTLAKLILQLEKCTSGEIYYRGEDLTKYSFKKMRKVRPNLQMIFQNSATSFNPYFTVRQIVTEPIRSQNLTKEEMLHKVVEMLRKLGLDESYLNRYGNELSGGQRQRVGIARALITEPEFVVCDEAVSSLDYIIKKQILDLLLYLKEEMDLTYLFISHDLQAVKRVCRQIVVMYMGSIVEILPELNEEIRHPYTKALLAASLGTNPRSRQKTRILFKENEEKIVPAQGCVFQNRCLYANDMCRTTRPEMKAVENQPDHRVACHLFK